MSNEFGESAKAASLLLFKALLDAVIVMVIIGLMELVKFALEEYMLDGKISDAEKPIRTIYYISKYSLIAMFSIYGIADVTKEIIKIIKNK